MLIPRFTLRWLLVATTVCGGMSLIISYAMRGSEWAIAVSIAALALPLLFLLHASAFGAAFLCSQITGFVGGRLIAPQASSPFAASGPPKQIIPPAEPE